MPQNGPSPANKRSYRVENPMSDIYAVNDYFKQHGLISEDQYFDLYKQSVEDNEKFWAEQAAIVDWSKPFTKVKDVSYAKDDLHIRWYEDGELNVCYNCVDRHLDDKADQPAIIWEGDDPDRDLTITYKDLHGRVSRFANVLKSIGVKKGDRVTIYMPMIPEAAVAMLACARIGAIHSVVFGGFSPDALAGRIIDCESNVVVTADEGLRGGRSVPLKANVDAAAKIDGVTTLEKVLVVRNTGNDVGWVDGRDVWLHEAEASVDGDCPCEPMNAEDPLFILYTSGSTGQPKGVLHTTGGYLVYAALTFKYVFNYEPGDIYWCTADVGWVTGHSYIVYGPLANGAQSMMFEGVPNYPDSSRFWQVCDKHNVNICYTAPTAIRALMREGDEPVKKTSRKSLRLLGSVGEPINPEAWEWYYNVVGEGRCPIVDTWWQTETGGILITPLPGATALKPGSATRPFFGVRRKHTGRCGLRLAGHTRQLARPDAHRLWRPRPVRADLFQRVRGPLLHGRRSAARRRRLLLDHGPRRRRIECLRPPHGYGRGRERARRPRGGRGGRGSRLSSRHQGAGHLRLCHAHGRARAQRRAGDRIA
jgi:acetyl-CoA synthetase